MTKLNLKTNASYNFKAPEIARDANKRIEAIFPTAEKVDVEIVDGAAVFTIDRQFLVVNIGYIADDIVLDGQIPAEALDIGASVVVIVGNYSGSSRLIDHDGDMDGEEIVLEDGEDLVALYVYDGHSLKHINPKQVKPTVGKSTVLLDGNKSVDITQPIQIFELEIPASATGVGRTVNFNIGSTYSPSVGDKLIVKLTNSGADNAFYFNGVEHSAMLNMAEGFKTNITFMYDGVGYIGVGDSAVSVGY